MDEEYFSGNFDEDLPTNLNLMPSRMTTTSGFESQLTNEQIRYEDLPQEAVDNIVNAIKQVSQNLHKVREVAMFASNLPQRLKLEVEFLPILKVGFRLYTFGFTSGF